MGSEESYSTRPIHLLDLPNEILAHIFVSVRGPPYINEPIWLGTLGYWDGGPKEIKNTRLVCRKFCNESSHLLMPAVSISANPSSLARLEGISRHPLIAKGVRTVRVIVHFYAQKLADEFAVFFPYQQQQLEYGTSQMKDLAEDPEFPWCGDAELESVAKSNRILDSWEKLAQNIPDSSLDYQDQENIRVIRRAYELYRQAHLEQERILTDGSFVREVANAVARMPVARDLFVADRDRSAAMKPASFVQRIEEPDLLIDSLVQPMSWSHAQENAIDTEPAELLSEIPVAIFKAGVMLKNIDYEIAPVKNFFRLFNSLCTFENLRAATQQLDSFGFHPSITRDLSVEDEEEDMKLLPMFVEAFMDTDSLRDIYINLGFLYQPEEVPEVSAGDLLLTRSWPRLRLLQFVGPLHFSELEKFYANVQGQVELGLKEVHLMSGSVSYARGLLLSFRCCFRRVGS